jgi:hypothetical protein
MRMIMRRELSNLCAAQRCGRALCKPDPAIERGASGVPTKVAKSGKYGICPRASVGAR